MVISGEYGVFGDGDRGHGLSLPVRRVRHPGDRMMINICRDACNQVQRQTTEIDSPNWIIRPGFPLRASDGYLVKVGGGAGGAVVVFLGVIQEGLGVGVEPGVYVG